MAANQQEALFYEDLYNNPERTSRLWLVLGREV